MTEPTQPRRGRPPGTGKPYKRPEDLYRPVLVRLPRAVYEELRRRVPRGKISVFVRQAVERALSDGGARERNETAF